MHCVDLGESFPTHILLQNLASIQLLTSPVKFARSPRAQIPQVPPLGPPLGPGPAVYAPNSARGLVLPVAKRKGHVFWSDCFAILRQILGKFQQNVSVITACSTTMIIPCTNDSVSIEFHSHIDCVTVRLLAWSSRSVSLWQDSPTALSRENAELRNKLAIAEAETRRSAILSGCAVHCSEICSSMQWVSEVPASVRRHHAGFG